MAKAKAPSGWYPSSDGRERFWNGSRWTDQWRGEPATTAEEVPSGTAPAGGTSLTYEAVLHIYKHAVATLAWSCFWFSSIGGIAAAVTYASTENPLDNPLVIVSAVIWGTLAAALSFAARSDARRVGGN